MSGDINAPTTLSRAEIQKIRRSLGANAYRLTPATYAAHVSGGRWSPAKHLLIAAAQIASAVARGNGRLIISIPPRHGKSLLTSEWTPQWVLDRDPAHQIMLTSYGSDLSTDFSRKARDNIIATNPQYCRAQVRDDVSQVGHWQTTKGGGMVAVGIGGPLTGRGAHLLEVDDYIKNAKEAASLSTRNSIYDWFVSTAMTRLEPRGTAIVVATRWNVDDLIGRLLKEHGHVWQHIRIPAVIETQADKDDDPLGRDFGEVLWPERYDSEAMALIKEDQGEYFWQALFQQRPIPRSGGLITRDNFIKVNIYPSGSNRLKYVRYWDLAGSPKGGDYTVGALLAYDPLEKLDYVLDIQRAQLSPLDVDRLVCSTAERDGHDVKIVMEQEPGSAGVALAEHFERDLLKGYDIECLPSTGDKFVRAQPFYSALQANHVRFLDRPWFGKLCDELELFPDVDHDDQVDACAGAYNALHKAKFHRVVWGRPDLEGVRRKVSGMVQQGTRNKLTWGR